MNQPYKGSGISVVGEPKGGRAYDKGEDTLNHIAYFVIKLCGKHALNNIVQCGFMSRSPEPKFQRAAQYRKLVLIKNRLPAKLPLNPYCFWQVVS